jgi:NAD(P)-dependent dehydrogenase (short-subunit alcohol dehydrogenase family)
MSLVSRLSRRGPSGFGYGSTAEQVTAGLNLSGRSYVVTGVTSGLGQETVRVLLLRGATVIALGRSSEKVREAVRGFAGADRVHAISLELADLTSVAEAAQEIIRLSLPLDALILNAGVMALAQLDLVSGYERQFFTNHIGHFYLARLLVDSLAPGGRVVLLSSGAQRAAPQGGIDFDNLRGERSYQPWTAYARSKLANLLFALELGERLRRTGRIAHAVHPGVIDTPLSRHLPALVRAFYPVGSAIFMKSIAEGAATQVYVATHPSVPYDAPNYWADCNVRRMSRVARDSELRTKLWELSTKIVNELGPVPLND